MARKISQEDGLAAVRHWAADPAGAGRSTIALAVRWTLQVLATDAPGRTVEVRVPPWGAVQCIQGPRHTRGTPPNVVEMKPEVWLQLATGQRGWGQAVAAGEILASGPRADIGHWLPLVRVSK